MLTLKSIKTNPDQLTFYPDPPVAASRSKTYMTAYATEAWSRDVTNPSKSNKYSHSSPTIPTIDH